MARPKRNNADYFSHDAGMRDDPKVKALRNKFGITGYAVWCMMLEILTHSDFFTIQIEELEIEILSADFGIEADLFSEILSYMVKLKLLQTNNNCEYLSQKLTDRLQSVLDKRRNASKKRVTVTESTQSKVKETKLKETKESNNTMSWIDEADATYLSTCEHFYKRLVELDRVKKNTEWKSKSWYDAFRLLLTTDGVSMEEFNRVMKYYFATPRTQYTPIADSPVSVRSKWQKLKDYQQRGSNGCKIDNSNLSTRP